MESKFARQPEITMGEALAFAFAKLSEHSGYCIGVLLGAEAVSASAAASLTFAFAALMRLALGLEWLPPDAYMYTFILFWLVMRTLVSAVVQRVFLHLVDDQVIGWDDILGIDLAANLPAFVKTLVGTVLYTIMVLIGLCFCVIPGLLVAVTFQFFKFAVLEEDADLLAAFQRSSELVHGHKLSLLGLDVAASVMSMVGVLIAVVGVIPVMALTTLAEAYIYNKLVERLQLQPIEASID